MVRRDCAADADYVLLIGVDKYNYASAAAAGVHDNVVKHNHLVYASETDSWRGIVLTSDAESNDIEFNGTATHAPRAGMVDRNTKPNASEPPPAARSCR
jgi:hypothetical protein